MLRIRRRLMAWALIVVGLPLLARGLHAAADAIEYRRGHSPATRRLHQAGYMADGLGGRLSRRKRRGRD